MADASTARTLLAGPVVELREAIREGTVDTGAVTAAALSAIDEVDGGPNGLNAFLSVTRDGPGEGTGDDGAGGPLAGVPVAVKDNLCTLGLPTTCGSAILEGYVSPYEATAVRRLREAGGVVIGKTNMDEFAMGASTENSAFGPTRNPVARDRVPGGSSGGSAAAVAAGLVPLALGSDTGGSVRQPASFSGIVGLKPTYGRVSRYGLIAFASSFDQVGCMARTVLDAARLLAVIAGPDPRDSTSVDGPAIELDRVRESDVAGLVVGLPREYFPAFLDPRTERVVRAAADRLADLGAEVREISLPHTEYAIPAYHLVASAEASSNLARYDGVRYGVRASEVDGLADLYRRSRGSGFGREVKRRIVLGTYGLSAGYYERYYERAVRVRREIAADLDAVFGAGVDIIFTPTTPTPAFRIGERAEDPVRMYRSDAFTVSANLAGVPAISLPIGTVDGLPVGGQLVGRRFDEATLLGAAHALEASLDDVGLAPRQSR